MALLRGMKRLCLGVAALSILCCIAVAFLRSVALAEVTVTATDEAVEPETGGLLSKLPFRVPGIDNKPNRPDYDLSLRLTSDRIVSLGTKQDQSAVGGLTWTLNDPVAVTDLASIRLRERGRFLTDPVVEVPLQADGVLSDGYQFSFKLERSLSVGLHSFFATPLGKALAAAFFLALLLFLLSLM